MITRSPNRLSAIVAVPGILEVRRQQAAVNPMLHVGLPISQIFGPAARNFLSVEARALLWSMPRAVCPCGAC